MRKRLKKKIAIKMVAEALRNGLEAGLKKFIESLPSPDGSHDK